MSNLRPVDLSAILAEPSLPERELQKIFRDDEPLTIFEIGACEGEDTIRYLRRMPRATVRTFEPLPENQAIIRENFSRYGVTRATLVPVALADKIGEAEFHVSSGRPREEFAGKDWNYGNKSSSLLAPASDQPMHGWIEFNETIKVPTDTLDHYCQTAGVDHIDFIHMDVQGAEYLVLQGAKAMLRNVTAIWLEVSTKELYRGQALDQDIRRLMRDAGFRLGYSRYQDDGIEGDHLYLNVRHPRTWFYLATRRVRSWLGALRLRLFK